MTVIVLLGVSLSTLYFILNYHEKWKKILQIRAIISIYQYINIIFSALGPYPYTPFIWYLPYYYHYHLSLLL